MPDRSIVCPKFEGTMEEGFIADLGESQFRQASEWVEGAPERDHSIFTTTGIKNWRGRRKFQVTTYRCAGCGYLESYTLLRKDY